MPRKRDRSPEAVLQRVITELETSDREGHPSHRAAVLTLLSEGPMMGADVLLREIQRPNPEISAIRAELICFLRQTVRLADQGGLFGYPLDVSRVRLYATAAGGRVFSAAEGTLRDVVRLQLFLLMQQVGLPNIRQCGAAEPGGCQRLFVKTYRREFCSIRCQQRDYKRRKRQDERERREQRARRRRITKGTR